MGHLPSLSLGGAIPGKRNKAIFRNIRCAAGDLSVTGTVTAVTLCLRKRDCDSSCGACHAFESCYAWLGCTVHTSQNSGPAVAPWRIGEHCGNGFSGVGDDDATVFSFDAMATKRGFG
jgi:hypothetical protein